MLRFAFVVSVLFAPLGAGGADVEQTAKYVMEKTNAFRKAEGLAPVRPDRELTSAAREFARFLAKTGKIGHTADGRQPVERAAAQGYEHCIVSENLAYLYRSSGYEDEPLAADMVEGWKKSPEHRKNMVDGAVTQTGVAIARDQAGRYFGVQMFGRPRSEAIRFNVRNEAGRDVAYRMGDRQFNLPARTAREHALCRPVELIIQSFRARPRDGATYAVVRRGNSVAVTEQPPR